MQTPEGLPVEQRPALEDHREGYEDDEFGQEPLTVKPCR
jgi:hypothetical protein